MSNPFRHPRIILPASSPAPAPSVVEFLAPVGNRVRFTAISVIAAVALMAAVDLGIVMTRSLPVVPQALLLGTPPLVAGLTWAIARFSAIDGYRLTPSELEIVRRRRTDRFPLAGLTGAEADSQAMAWSVKVLGNDGLGAITGRYRNRRLGSYRAFVTDPARLVVLRWPERCLVVSPDRPEEFVREVRRRAGGPG